MVAEKDKFLGTKGHLTTQRRETLGASRGNKNLVLTVYDSAEYSSTVRTHDKESGWQQAERLLSKTGWIREEKYRVLCTL